MSLLFYVTPFLGCLRNYIKYKQIDILLFVRTPITYLFIIFLFGHGHDNIYQTLIYERWFFFIYKTCLSIYKNDYITKKDKYIKNMD